MWGGVRIGTKVSFAPLQWPGTGAQRDTIMTEVREPLRRQNGMIAGICGGFALFFGIRPVRFRLLFVLLLVPGGLPGLIPYLILWVVIPKKR